MVSLNHTFRALLCACAFALLFSGRIAFADDGLYIQTFDPIQQTQLDGAIAAAEKFGLDRVILIPDPNYSGTATLATRWKLLEAAAKSDPRFIVPSYERLKLLSGDKKAQERFWSEMKASQGKLRPIEDGQKTVTKLKDKKLGSPIKIVAKGQPLGGARSYVRVLNSPAQEQIIQANPARAESLLPEAAADIVRAEKLYGHNGLRGFYGLPQTLTRQLDMEQKLNDRIENTKEFASIMESDLPQKFYPEERPTFAIHHVDVPAEKATFIRTGKVPDGVIVKKNGKEFVRFFVHPQSEKLFREILGEYEWEQKFWATPTSSHRSLIVWDPTTQDPPFGVKSTLDATIGANLRHLSKGQVQRAAAVSALVNTFDEKKLAEKGMIFIDEPFGVYLNGLDNGYAIRNLPELPPGHEMVPMFSLYSKPPGGPPPIVQLVKDSGLSAREFAEKMIVKPLVDHASYLAWEEGMVGEPHEQNLLMRLVKGKPDGTIYYRDLAGFILNPDLRAAAGKDMSFLPKEVDPKNLKLSYGKPISNALAYLRQSNFYAMQRALEPYFPEISQKWLDEVFREHMRRNIRKYTGVDSKNIPDWERAYKEHVKDVPKFDCEKGFAGSKGG